MKKIAVITGASSGMGRRFAETVDQYGTFDEVWVIARRAPELEALRKTVPFPIRPLALDLTDRRSFAAYAEALAAEPVEVGLLLNASGFGKFRAVMDTPLDVNLNMTDLNCQAVVAMCQLTIPYMPQGGQIINIASVAAFQPIPYINIYGATKAFVLSFSRPEPGAAQPRHRRDGGVPLLDKDLLFRPRRGRRGDAGGKKVRGHVRPCRHRPPHMAGRQAKAGRVQIWIHRPVPGWACQAPAPPSGHGCVDAPARSVRGCEST